MKKMYYNRCTRINHGTEDAPKWEDILNAVQMTWNEVNEAIAKSEAYNGEYTIEDDGIESSFTPTAQDDTNAMLIDHEYRLTLLELGITESEV